MRKIVLSSAALFLGCASLYAAEVEVQVKPSPAAKSTPVQSPKPRQKTTPTPAPQPTSAQATPSQPAGSPGELPLYRPAVLGTGLNSVINRIDTQDLINKGQKDGSIMFSCAVTFSGEITNTLTYRGTPESLLLEQELVRRLDQAVFFPAVYNHRPVNAIFFGTVTFAIVNGKARLRIFANQEKEELKKESDFIGPQPFFGRDSKFEGFHYPEQITLEIPGMVELAMKVDADGNLKELQVVSEDPPLLGFRRAAAEDFRVARFIPAFRDGKPVECNITLPVYYEP